MIIFEPLVRSLSKRKYFFVAAQMLMKLNPHPVDRVFNLSTFCRPGCQLVNQVADQIADLDAILEVNLQVWVRWENINPTKQDLSYSHRFFTESISKPPSLILKDFYYVRTLS